MAAAACCYVHLQLHLLHTFACTSVARTYETPNWLVGPNEGYVGSRTIYAGSATKKDVDQRGAGPSKSRRHSRSAKRTGTPQDRWGREYDVGSTNLYYRGSYCRLERLCGSGTYCSVFASGHQCVAHSTACRQVRTVGDLAARTCRGA